MSPLCIAFIFSITVIFLIILLSAFFKKSTDRLIAKIDDTKNPVEIQLRELLKKNPGSEIYICNNSKSEESYEIIKKLAEDYPQIHILES